MSEIKYGEGLAELLGDDLATLEYKARMYETVTHAAREMTPLLTQEFMVRVKGSSNLGFSINKEHDAQYLGKWIEATVYWEGTNFFTLNIKGDWRTLMFSGDEFEKHVTQKGLAPKMYATWKLANNK